MENTLRQSGFGDVNKSTLCRVKKEVLSGTDEDYEKDFSKIPEFRTLYEKENPGSKLHFTHEHHHFKEMFFSVKVR